LGTLSSGLALGYLSVIVLVPLAAVSVKGAHGGWHHFWQVAWNPESKAALELTLGLALAIVAINAVTGTALAWTLVRDEFPGKRLVNAHCRRRTGCPLPIAGLIRSARQAIKAASEVKLFVPVLLCERSIRISFSARSERRATGTTAAICDGPPR